MYLMNLHAIFYATICAICLSIAPVFMKKISAEVSALNAVFLISLVTTFLAAIGLLFFEETSETIQGWTNKTLLFFVLAISIVFFIESISYVKALQEGAPIGLLLVYIRTGAMVATPILGIILFQEKITPYQWIGIGLATASIFFILLGTEKTE